MSIVSIQSNVNRINEQIAVILKRQVDERKKENGLESKINDLSHRIVSSSNQTSIKSYQRQKEAKSRELVRVKEKIAEYQKQLTVKQKELSRFQNQLTREQERERKKVQRDELRFLKEKERINQADLRNLHNYNAALEKQQRIFTDYMVSEENLSAGEGEGYSLNELSDLHKLIDTVLEQLEKLGFGQEIIFDEIEELKMKGMKVTKKDMKMLLIGKLVSFGSGKINPALAAEIFREITTLDLKLLP